MRISPMRTRVLTPPKDELEDVISSICPLIEARSILVVSSKVVSIWQGRCVRGDEDRDALIRSVSTRYLPRTSISGPMISITNGVLTPDLGGIDASNADDFLILPPKEPSGAAARIRQQVIETMGISEFGVIVADSHTRPLRRGLIGIAVGFAGIAPSIDYRGTTDLFGRVLDLSVVNVPDAVAAATVLTMGESDERTPLALVTDLPARVRFRDGHVPEDDGNLLMSWSEDIFAPLLQGVEWHDGGQL